MNTIMVRFSWIILPCFALLYQDDFVYGYLLHSQMNLDQRIIVIGMKLKHILEVGDAATDPRVKLQARAIANDCYKFIIEMSTNAGMWGLSINQNRR
jgi:hypothetical protein